MNVLSTNVRPARVDDSWHVLKVLGQGGEGSVYLVEDKTTSRRWVLKSFHNPLPASQLQSLQIYQSGILAGDCPGLPEVELVRDRDQILGVRYPYIALHRVHWRMLRSIRHIGQAMVGSYCRMQQHLISRHGIAIWDADPVNFMLARNGYFYWTDFGTGMEVVNRPDEMVRGGFEYGFAALLLGIQGINFKLLAQYESYTYDGPCIYFMHPALDDAADKHRWVRDLVEMVRSQQASAFLQPEFYQQLGARLPKRLSAPAVIIGASHLLSQGGRLGAGLLKDSVQ